MIRAKCDSCGAALKKARQRGKYVCEHCGTIYYDNIPQAAAWDSDFSDAPSQALDHFPSQQDIFTKSQQKTPANNILITLAILVTSGGFLVALLVGGLTRSDEKSSPFMVKPEMLSVLPSGEQVGVPVPYAGWELVVNPEFGIKDNNLFFEFSLRNWQDGSQSLRYLPNAFVVYDDVGNNYSIDRSGCAIDSEFIPRQIMVEPNRAIEFSSRSSWCNNETNVPVYKGVIPLEAKHLYLHFSEFGVYKNITFVFDL